MLNIFNMLGKSQTISSVWELQLFLIDANTWQDYCSNLSHSSDEHVASQWFLKQLLRFNSNAIQLTLSNYNLVFFSKFTGYGTIIINSKTSPSPLKVLHTYVVTFSFPHEQRIDFSFILVFNIFQWYFMVFNVQVSLFFC